MRLTPSEGPHGARVCDSARHGACLGIGRRGQLCGFGDAITEQAAMNPTGGSTSHLHERPFAFGCLGNDGHPRDQNRKHSLIRGRSGAKIDALGADEACVAGSNNLFRFVEDAFRDATGAVGVEDRCAEAAFSDLTFGFFELLSGASDLQIAPGRAGSGAFDLDAGHGERGNGIRAGVAPSHTGFNFDQSLFSGSEIRLKTVDLERQLLCAFGLRTPEECRLLNLGHCGVHCTGLLQMLCRPWKLERHPTFGRLGASAQRQR